MKAVRLYPVDGIFGLFLIENQRFILNTGDDVFIHQPDPLSDGRAAVFYLLVIRKYVVVRIFFVNLHNTFKRIRMDFKPF